MVLPSRLRTIEYKVRTGHFRDALHGLEAVYDPAGPLDRLLMANIRFHTGQWRDAETLALELTAGRDIPIGIQGRACDLLTWLIKHKHGVPNALSFAEKSLQLASKANDLEQTCRAQLTMLVAKADAYGPDGLGNLIAETHSNVMRLGDAHLIAWLHIRLAEVEARRGRFDQTERHLDLVASRDRAPHDDLLAAVQVHLLRGVAATLALHPERSLAHNRDALRSAREAGYQFGEVAALLNMGQLCLSMNRLDEARGFLDMAEPLLGDRLPLTIGWTDTRAQLELAEGNLRECQRQVNRLAMLSEINRSPKPSYSSLEATLTRVRLQRRQGDMRGALSLLEEGVREARARRSPVLEATFEIQRADVLLEMGRAREALQALRNASRHSLGSFITVLGEAERVRARAAGALGLPALAQARQERATRIFTAIGRPPVNVSPAQTVDRARLDAREAGLLMLEAAANLLELGGRRDLLAAEVFSVCQHAIGDGGLALVLRRGDERELRQAVNWSRSLAGQDIDTLARVTIPARETGPTYELLLDTPDDAVLSPLLDDLQALVDASSRLDAVRAQRLKTSAHALTTGGGAGAIGGHARAGRGAGAARTAAAGAAHAEARGGQEVRDADEDADAQEFAGAAATGVDAGTGARAGQGAGRAIFSSPVMLDLLRQAQRVGRTDLTVLIAGETGAGKEMLAEEIRRASGREWARYAKIVCSSLPREPLASSLFGQSHGSSGLSEKEAQNAIGPVNGGTVLLDEIGELPPDKQMALLRLIDTKEVHPAAAARPLPLDVRFICVTNANLEQLVLDRRFREDLFHRINVVSLRIPPLRERRDEILPLARHFLAHLSARQQRPMPELSDEAAEQLLVYGWPGNVRELRNEMERLVSLLDHDVTLVPVESLSDNVRLARPGAGLGVGLGLSLSAGQGVGGRLSAAGSAFGTGSLGPGPGGTGPGGAGSGGAGSTAAGSGGLGSVGSGSIGQQGAAGGAGVVLSQAGGPDAAGDLEQVVIRANQPLRLALEELEREIIARRIREAPGNLDRIAAGLGLSRKGLYFKRQRYGLL